MNAALRIAPQLRRTSRRLHTLAHRSFNVRTGWHAEHATEYWSRADACDEEAETLDPCDPSDRPYRDFD